MSDIEVTATRSFSHMGRNYTRGRTYRVDTDDAHVMGLLAGGYLVNGPGRGSRGRLDPIDVDFLAEFIAQDADTQSEVTGDGQDQVA